MKTILVIDDQKDNLTTITAIMKSNMPECKVLTALSGKEGIEIARKEQPNSILLDIIMPDMDGYEVCKRLKEDESTKHVPVIMVTAIKTDSESRIKSLNFGADAFLSKPIDPIELSVQLNVMIRIKEAEDKLREEKKNLENVVLNRTKELIKINKDLELEVSERMQAEDDREQSRSLLKAALESTADGILVVTKEGTWSSYNQKFVEMWGIPSSIFESGDDKAALDYVFDSIANPELFLAIVKELYDNPERNSFDTIELKDSRIFERYSHPQHLGKEVVGRVWSFRDVSERKRAEQIQKVLYNISNAVITTDNLRKLIILIQQELRTIIDTTNFYVALYDQKTDMFSVPYLIDEKDKFDTFPAGKTLTSYVNKTQKSLFGTKDRIHELVESGDIEMYGTDSEIWIGVPLIVEGYATGVLAVQSYTNENAFNESDMKMLEFVSTQIGLSIHRKKAEEDLVTALANAKESDRLKSAFLANMSHEIRTPMNGILGFAELLKEPGLSREELQSYVSVIESSGDRMLNTINDLIDISKIEAGQMEVVFSTTVVNEIINDLYSFFKLEAEQKGLQLVCRKSLSGKEATIETDKEKLYAVLTNLIKNSIKYTHKGSIEFGYQVIDGLIEFFVNDTGVGIPQDRQHAIFERFVQADLSRSRSFEGAGLGLSISKAYVEMLGGGIRVESEENKGTKFYFTIQYSTIMKEKAASKDALPEIKSEVKIKKLKILIAEDDETADLHLSIVLKSLDREIFHTRTGREAVEFCRNNPDTDLVLMDIKMPEVDGHEASRQIRKFNKKVVIIAQTAYALEGDREQALKAGCNDYISKPIKKDLLLAMVMKHINAEYF